MRVCDICHKSESVTDITVTITGSRERFTRLATDNELCEGCANRVVNAVKESLKPPPQVGPKPGDGSGPIQR